MKLADFSFVDPCKVWEPRQFHVCSFYSLFARSCSLCLHTLTQQQTFFAERRKIALARDREIRKDCHDMHVVFWVKIRATKSLKEFLLWACRELRLEHVVFESDTIKTWKLCRQQNYLPHINWVFWEAKMCSKKQNSNWDGEGCRGPFQTCFASGTSCTS